MHNKAIRGVDCVGVPWGTSKQDRPKGNEVRGKRRPGALGSDVIHQMLIYNPFDTFSLSLFAEVLKGD